MESREGIMTDQPKPEHPIDKARREFNLWWFAQDNFCFRTPSERVRCFNISFQAWKAARGIKEPS